MRNILLITATLIAFSGFSQKKVGYFGKKNFISIGANPTFDFKLGDFLDSPLYLDGEDVKRQGVFTFRPGGINLGYSRAISNRFLIGAIYRRSNFKLYHPQPYSTGTVYSPISMERNQFSVHVEFSSYEWNSLIMGNFMNRIEVGYEKANLPLEGEIKTVFESSLGEDQQLSEQSVVNTFGYENIYTKPESFGNSGLFLRYSAMQSMPLSETFILRYGFDATFHLTYMEMFRGELDYFNWTQEEVKYGITVNTFKLMAFRSIVNFRTELIIAL
ncbi:hypothetical protein SAMN05216474_3109 [Lishizhenia tianjinensis]|uniref:Uncharacterized protein n=1 Tax=Lishizhenia tianjinensis TaxID=477690 RepID=A0A1I7BV24_9FLAO|nr:hypothetical protein [Lishizhenia tianjinensis]SFT90961.1 hypothetical protein SAMN05216474_3109 [Lishizhenia tianjinensis]